MITMAEVPQTTKDYFVYSGGGRSGTWHATEEEARSEAQRRSKRKAPRTQDLHYEYTVTHAPPGQGWNNITTYHRGEDVGERAPHRQHKFENDRGDLHYCDLCDKPSDDALHQT